MFSFSNRRLRRSGARHDGYRACFLSQITRSDGPGLADDGKVTGCEQSRFLSQNPQLRRSMKKNDHLFKNSIALMFTFVKRKMAGDSIVRIGGRWPVDGVILGMLDGPPVERGQGFVGLL